MRIVRTRHSEIAMNHMIAASGKPMITGIAMPGLRFAHKARFAAGITINLGGAGLLLSDLNRVAPSFG